LNALFSYLKEKEGLNQKDILDIIEKKEKHEDIFIPICVFNEKLSVLESVVKYLKEDVHLKYCDIAKILHRNDRTIWSTYSNSKKKFSGHLKIKKCEYFIPVSIFDKENYSVFELIVYYLKDEIQLRYSEIGLLMRRDQRTIWTVYNRKKR
jgi:predicted nucleic-acid-binding protein